MTKKFTYPEAHKVDVVDDYHGTQVADPYRWMEDPDAPDTVAWVEKQNTLSREYLDEITAREGIHKRLTAIWNYPKFTVPTKKGNRYFYTKNDGLQNQPIVYWQDGLDAEPVELLNPNTLSDDGTIAMNEANYNKDGTLMAYRLSSGGSDWQTIHIRNVETGEDYDEVLEWVKFSSIAWHGDGFFYNRFPETEADNQGLVYDNYVCWHKLGTPQSEDVVVYKRPDKKELGFQAILSDDEQYLVLYVWHAAINRNRVYYRPIDSDGDFIRLIDEPDAEYIPIGNDGSTFFMQTDFDAPRGRIVAIDLDNPERENWTTVILEQDDVILAAGVYNQKIVVLYQHNAYHQIKVYDFDGAFVQDIPLPGIGKIFAMSGKHEEQEMFYQFESYLYPPTIFRYDFDDNTSTVWQSADVDFTPDDYETVQVFYPSKDGTQVSMFLTHKKGLELNGDNRTLLYGYGGYSIPLNPEFAPHILNWIELGGVYAVANLRGGSEYGEEWHQGGMLANKQNTFDDFIAAAEWLIENKYTRSQRLAIMGGSNGGLLVGACMTQRPDLFGAVICAVPVTDMLRFHMFTAGRYWTAEYGNAEESKEHFDFMYAYSPLHNVKEGTTYPATMILTADHDDRVVPMHAEKFAATLQAADSGNNPILLRLDMRAGHGLGKPTSKRIDEIADIQAFLMNELS